MTLDTTRLVADIAKLKTVDTSILALLGAFAAQVKDLSARLADAIANGNLAGQNAIQAELDGLANDVEGETDRLSAAVVANTSAAPAVVAKPVDVTSPAPGAPTV